MFDELGRLAADEKIMQLLSHYGDIGAENQELWHPRLRTIESIDDGGLVRLHGTLIAFGWVEQNTGGPGCTYRITTAGQRALRRVRSGLSMHEDLSAEAS